VIKKKESNYLLFLIYLIPISLIFSKLISEIIIVLTTGVIIYKFKIDYIKKKFQDLNLFQKNLIKYFFFFFFLIFVNKLANFSNYEDLFKSLALLRFPIFLLVSFIFLSSVNRYLFLNKIYIFILVSLILSIDIWLQFFSGKNLFGYNFDNDLKRAGSFFKDEYIAGSFLFYIFFYVGFFFNFFKKKIFIIILLLIVYIIIYFSGDRQPFILLNLGLLLFFVINFLNIKKFIIKNKKVLYLIIFIPFFLIFFKAENFLIERYKLKNSIAFDHYKFHLESSIQNFQDNIFFGSGYKTWKKDCNKSDPETRKCSTHPHNFYLEILADNGLIGILFFIFIFYFLLKNFFILFFIKKKFIFEFLFFILYFFPFKPTGSFYTNFNLIMFFYTLLMIFIKMQYLNEKKI